MSRIDGRTSETEIAHGTGLDSTRVSSALNRLRELNAIRFEGEVLEPEPQPARVSDAPRTLRSKAGPEPAPSKAKEPPSGKQPRPFDDAAREDVDRALRELDGVDHYRALGVLRDADKSTIKRTYFSLIGQFHPDRYFGTDLGEYKSKLEKVFGKLTEAYDTLTRSRLRAEYDATLGAALDDEPLVQNTKQQPSQSGESVKSSEARIMDREPGSLQNEPSSTQSKPGRISSRAPSAANVHDSSSTPPAKSSSGAPHGTPSLRDSDARRRNLARRLNASAPPSLGRPSATLEAVAAFRPSMMRSADTIPAPKQSAAATGLHRFILQADQALRDANPIAAANSLRLALAITPDDPVLRQRLEETQLAADVRLKDRLVLDAVQAEKDGRLAEAASLYGRAARGAESGDLYLRAAECSIKAGENPRLAADFAKAGLKHTPDHAKLRLVLGRIYAEAGMTASALSELEKARRLEPDDVTIQTWLERVRKGPLA